MIAAVSQMIFGGVLLAFVVWMKLSDCGEVLEMCMRRSKLKHWIKTLIIIILGLLGLATMVDPMIPGVAGLIVRVPAEVKGYQGLPEHLRVKVFPLGLTGIAGGDR